MDFQSPLGLDYAENYHQCHLGYTKWYWLCPRNLLHFGCVNDGYPDNINLNSSPSAPSACTASSDNSGPPSDSQLLKYGTSARDHRHHSGLLQVRVAVELQHTKVRKYPARCEDVDTPFDSINTAISDIEMQDTTCVGGFENAEQPFLIQRDTKGKIGERALGAIEKREDCWSEVASRARVRENELLQGRGSEVHVVKNGAHEHCLAQMQFEGADRRLHFGNGVQVRVRSAKLCENTGSRRKQREDPQQLGRLALLQGMHCVCQSS
ncbi:hypothetical protein DFH08DRAFT_1016868 [Mycena albidolilacea]|uniref:Uncharacterized protein n=1 Tax=Mycena albidolilacea TaxID=1033008 RepID=A0AAD7APW6_9AGAR|nr:hypothetical protein DFH08DRAFT_1016868 [Mycena albidolilacea]